MDMSMGGMDMSMGNVSMGNGIPSPFTFEKMYWAVVGAVIAAFTLVNLYSHFLFRQRLRSTSMTPAKPKAFPFLLMATSTALLRELANASIPVFAIKSLRMPSPTLGKASIVGANIVTLLVMCFYKLDVSDRWSFENIGYRTGFVTLCQLPLLFLLAGKRNIIAALIGSSYERINWLHRWASRCFFLTATIHMGYWFADWAPYDYIGTKIRTDPITKHGVIAWAVLVWIIFSSMSPIRGWSYEFFVVQHIVSFAVFIGFIYLHIPIEVKHWVWICVGLFFFDRVVRGFSYLYNNLSILHPAQRKSGDMGKLWALNAELTALPNNTTRVTIKNPPISWSPGQHVFLSAQSLAPIQAHPFTISSIPSDGKMEFLIQSQKGGTRKFYQHAERLGSSLPQNATDPTRMTSVAIEGPYGHIRPLQQFDSVVLLAGSSGASFTMPLLRDLVRSWKAVNSQRRSQRERPVTRHVRYVWIVKSGPQLSHFSVQLGQVMDDVARLQDQGHDVSVDISAYITCDDTFTTEQRTLLDAWKAYSTLKPNKHGSVTEVVSSVDSEKYDHYKAEKQFDLSDEEISVHEMDRYLMSEKTVPVTSKPSCGPNGACCCTATIQDEDDDDAIKTACTCNCGPSSPRLDSTASSKNLDGKAKPKQPFLHPAISVFSGRPACRNVIRKTLEQAYGESAVVVCGPQGLVSDVRTSVVSLSDERAVHKGTGAQGIWLHAEAFGY
jgi:predicted ferric reductase